MATGVTVRSVHGAHTANLNTMVKMPGDRGLFATGALYPMPGEHLPVWILNAAVEAFLPMDDGRVLRIFINKSHHPGIGPGQEAEHATFVSNGLHAGD